MFSSSTVNIADHTWLSVLHIHLEMIVHFDGIARCAVAQSIHHISIDAEVHGDLLKDLGCLHLKQEASIHIARQRKSSMHRLKVKLVGE